MPSSEPIEPPTIGRSLIAPGLLRRMAAFLYEGVLLFGVCVATALVYSPLVQQHHALKGRLGLEVSLFVVIGAYFVWFWTHGGQTLAMKTWHVRLVDRAGQPVHAGRAALRYALSWMWFAPLALAYTTDLHPRQSSQALVLSALMLAWMGFYAALSFFHPQRQFWHDALAGTRLVDAREPATPGVA